MKVIFSATLLFLSAIGICAQTPVDPIGAPVTVIKQEWRFQIRNPSLDESPFLDIEDRVQTEQDLRDTAAENRRRARIGVRPVKPPERPATEKNDGPASAVYIYKIKVKNTGAKEVRALTLEYVFSELDTKREISRRQFVSNEEIDPGDTTELIFRSIAPPTGTINAGEAGKKSGKLYFEQVFIRNVEYTDGTTWQAKKIN